MPATLQSSSIPALLPHDVLPLRAGDVRVATDANGFKIPNALISHLNARSITEKAPH
jgi:hypothetical protein